MKNRIGAAQRPMLLALSLVTLAGGAMAAPPAYQVQMLPVPGTGSYSATAMAVNSQGVVAVNYAKVDGDIDFAGYLCSAQQCTAIPRLYPKAAFGVVNALNDAGVATGWSDDVMSQHLSVHAYTFDGTTLVRIPGFDQDGCGGCSLDSAGNGINASGHVVGYSKTAKGRMRAFLRRDGVMLELGLSGHTSEALGINAADSVVGKSDVKTGQVHAFLYRDGKNKDLGTLGGNYSVARAINTRGHIVGSSSIDSSGLTVPFVFKKGQMTALPMFDGAYWADAYALNKADWVVGQTRTADWEDHAFLYDGTAVYDLNDMLSDDDRAQWRIEQASGINDLGQIAATGRHRSSGAIRAFLFSPTALAAAGAPR